MNAKANVKTLNQILEHSAQLFESKCLYYGHGTDNAWDDAVALALYVLKLPADADASVGERKLTAQEQAAILTLVNQRIQQRIPVPYLTHQAYFCGLPFYVDERVLIPRSPVAELIEQAFTPWIKPEKIKRVLDLGTGSACIAIACAYAFPGALVDAVDVDAAAIEVANRNVVCHGLEGRMQVIESDLFANLNNRYDIIISNPPYVDAKDMANLPEEYLYEPQHALAAGEDGLLFVDIILREAKDYLTEEGILIVEVGNSQEALEKKYPQLPFVWLEFERGGNGIFLLYRKDL